MNKHAYLIMAHGQWAQLQKLLTLLDDSRNDIFLHVDANAGDFDAGVLHVEHSSLHMIERKPVYWAAYSQTDAELRLLQAATEAGSYAYYHLLSGADLPLKTQDDIHDFFDNSGKLFIAVKPQEFPYSIRRTRYYHWLLENRYYRNTRCIKGLNLFLEHVQRLFGVDRLKGRKFSVYNGWTWFSITDAFARYVLSKKAWIECHFRHTIASDEHVMSTLVMAEPDFRSQLYGEGEGFKRDSQRFIDWKRGKPYIWGSGCGGGKMLCVT